MTTKRQWQHRFSSTTVNKRNVKCETRLYIISTDVFEQRLMHMIKTWDDNKFGRETNFAKIYNIYTLTSRSLSSEKTLHAESGLGLHNATIIPVTWLQPNCYHQALRQVLKLLRFLYSEFVSVQSDAWQLYFKVKRHKLYCYYLEIHPCFLKHFQCCWKQTIPVGSVDLQ